MSDQKHFWLFKATDFSGTEFYLDENGNETEEENMPAFVGTSLEAQKEADRRSDLWEETNRWLISKIERIAKGNAE